MTEKRVRVGVIGAGGFIGRCHVESMRRLGYVDVVAIAGSTPESARHTAADLHVPTAYGDWRDLVADDSIDVVDVAAVNSLHFRASKAALEAGRHVYCEKPLGLDADETAELVAVAARSGRAHGVAFNHRYYPMIQEAAARISDGELGDVFHVSGGYLQDGMLLPSDYNWRIEESEGGEKRVLGDLGAHWFDTIEFMTDKTVTAVLADIRTTVPLRGKPLADHPATDMAATDRTEEILSNSADLAMVMLRFADGSSGTVTVSQVHAGRKCSLRVEAFGMKASVAFDSEDSNRLWLGSRTESNRLFIKDPSLMTDSGRHVARYPSGHEEGFPDTHTAVLREFLGSIHDGSWRTHVTYPTFASGHRVQQIIDACYSSAQQDSWVQVPGTGEGSTP